MPKFATRFKAVRASDGALITYGGPYVDALTWKMAQIWCNENMPWLTIDGEVQAIIAANSNKRVDCYAAKNN